MPDTPQPDWSAVRADYVSGAGTVVEIAARHAISTQQIYSHARRDGWPLRRAAGVAAGRGGTQRRDRPSSVEREALIARIYRALATNLELMEKRMSKDETSTSADTERDMRALGSLVQTVEKAKEMEADTSSAGAAAPGSRARKPQNAAEADGLRRRLAERIRRLRERARP